MKESWNAARRLSTVTTCVTRQRRSRPLVCPDTYVLSCYTLGKSLQKECILLVHRISRRIGTRHTSVPFIDDEGSEFLSAVFNSWANSRNFYLKCISSAIVWQIVQHEAAFRFLFSSCIFAGNNCSRDTDHQSWLLFKPRKSAAFFLFVCLSSLFLKEVQKARCFICCFHINIL